MAQKVSKGTNPKYKAWHLDQLAKSAFFHQKLHEWQILEVGEAISQVQGEDLDWSPSELSIADAAWKKVIHRGIKPVVVFAHPAVLQTVKGAVGYYRMLAMVSQKSMNQTVGAVQAFERGTKMPDDDTVLFLANHLNRIISHLVETDEKINAKEFDLWRGMAAGSQAQGSWQNAKGSQAEILVKTVIEQRIRAQSIVTEESPNFFTLLDQRRLAFSSEPDISILKNGLLEVAIEVKGGIDPAGVLERVGAAIKSLRRAKQENPQSVTVLIMQGVSFSERARKDIDMNREAIDQIFMLEEVLEESNTRERFFQLLGL